MEEMAIQYRYEVTGDGLQAVNALTGAVMALATAEDLVKRKAAEMTAAFAGVRPPRGAESPAPGPADSAEPSRRADEDWRARDTAAPSRLREPDRRTLAADDERPADDSRLARSIDALVGELRRLPELLRGLRSDGGSAALAAEDSREPSIRRTSEPPRHGARWMLGGAAKREFEEQLERKREEDEARQQRWSTIASRTTAVASGVTAATRLAADYHGAFSTPHMTDRDRWTAFLPAGKTMRAASDWVFHGTDLIQKLKTEEMEDAVRESVERDHRAQMRELEGRNLEIRRRRTTLDTMKTEGTYVPPVGYLLDGDRGKRGERSTARETVGEREKYEDVERERPARERVGRADLEWRTLMGLQQDMAKQDEQRSRRLDEIMKRIWTLDTDAHKAAVDWPVTAQEIKKLQREREEIVTVRREEIGKRRELSDRLAGANREKEDAFTGLHGVQQGELRQRELTARDQSARLADADPAGRAMAEMLPGLVNEIGYENLPAELRAQYQHFHPKLARAQAEQAGKQFIPTMQAVNPADYRDTIEGAAEKFDKAQREGNEQIVDTIGTYLDSLVQASVKNITEFKDSLARRLEEAIKTMEREAFIQNRQDR